jgi:hypothetical protein
VGGQSLTAITPDLEVRDRSVRGDVVNTSASIANGPPDTLRDRLDR